MLAFDPKHLIGPNRQKELAARYDRILITGRARSLVITIWGIPQREWKNVTPPGLKADATWWTQGAYCLVKMPNPVTVPDQDWLPHEVGHALKFSLFTQDMNEKWARFWSANQKRMPSGYGRRDAEEGFAECFEAVCGAGLHPGLSRPDLVIVQEVNDLVRMIS